MDFVKSWRQEGDTFLITCPYCQVISFDADVCTFCHNKYPEGTFIHLLTDNNEKVNVTGITRENYPRSTYHPLSKRILPPRLWPEPIYSTGNECDTFEEITFQSKAVKEMELRMEKLLKGIGKGMIDPNEDLPLPPKLREACLNIRSLERLFPRKWLNDHLINFYCLYLAKEKFTRKPDSFIIYSTYFYESLEKFCSGKTGYRLARPRGEDKSILKKDFVIVPVNWKNEHWITLVICHPCLIKDHIDDHIRVRRLQGGRTRRSSVYSIKRSKVVKERRTPCMLIFDSLASPRDVIFSNMRRYLREEYKRFHEVDVDFSKFPGYYVDCPQQKNDFDCGIFTLHNIEMLLGNTEMFPGYPPDLRYWYHDEYVKYKREELMTLCTGIVRKSLKLS